MDVASICSLPPIERIMPSSASFLKTSTASNTNSVESSKNKSTLPSISSLLHPISKPSEKSSKQQDNPTALLSQPYLQSKLNSVDKNSANNSPSLLNLRSLSLESPVRSQPTHLHPSPPLTTPSLSRSNSNLHIEHTRSPRIHSSLNALTSEHRPSPPESVAPYPDNSFTSSTTYQKSQWQSQQRPSSTENDTTQIAGVPSRDDDSKQSSALKLQQQNMQYNAAIAANGFPSEYHHYRASFEKDVYQSVNRGNEKTMADLKKIIDHCALISQFASQYGEIRSRIGNYRPDVWPMQQAASLPTEAHVTDMINKAFEVLYVLNALKDETNRRGPTEIDLIRNKRTSSGISPARPKYRKRTKRPAPPGRCHSCNIQETPEWRRGPDGARTLCNACGLHFAKLTRKRAQIAIQEQQQRLAQQRTALHHPYPSPYLQMSSQRHYPGFPQHTIAQNGSQFINTTTPTIPRGPQVDYSSTTRIEID
ncbi:9138_t:CDS:2 [Funneliformis geosporum]|uniref:9138_t:CDS:1 n=1 Tax=Funneliformis geosporum TaxID=1117311 RepID=A0A9W4SHW5_9GLOM|nr:9138_t:CDS:2 [Funneliformis geosporum]